MDSQPHVRKSSQSQDIVAAVYGTGRAEARIRGTNDVIASADDVKTLARNLRLQFPDGFVLEVRYDPHM